MPHLETRNPVNKCSLHTFDSLDVLGTKNKMLSTRVWLLQSLEGNICT